MECLDFSMSVVGTRSIAAWTGRGLRPLGTTYNRVAPPSGRKLFTGVPSFTEIISTPGAGVIEICCNGLFKMVVQEDRSVKHAGNSDEYRKLIRIVKE